MKKFEASPEFKRIVDYQISISNKITNDDAVITILNDWLKLINVKGKFHGTRENIILNSDTYSTIEIIRGDSNIKINLVRYILEYEIREVN